MLLSQIKNLVHDEPNDSVLGEKTRELIAKHYGYGRGHEGTGSDVS